MYLFKIFLFFLITPLFASSQIILGCTNESYLEYDSTASLDDGSCYNLIVMGCTNPEAANYNLSANMDDDSCEFSPFDVIQTDCNMTVLLPGDLNISLDGEQITSSVWIGVTDSDGIVCGEALFNPGNVNSVIVWDESNSSYGMSIGETLNWVAMIDGEMTTGEALYQIWGYDEFACNGLSGITSLDFISPPSVQSIQLEQGWNIFSSNLLLENPNVENVFSPVSSSILLVKDDLGNVYWPMVGLNQIEDLEIGKAYMSKMTFNTSLDFIGTSIEPENIVLELNEGWSFLGYLRDSPMDVLQVVENDFVDIRDDIIIMKDGAGNVFWPEYELNSIQNMYPGQGYLIKMSNDSELSYLPNDFEYYNLPLVWPDLNNPLDLQNTAGNATMMINLNDNEISLDGNFISSGDKIGIFYEGENKWLCSGFLIWDETMPPAALTIWGNNDDGFGLMDGDQLKMFIYDSSTGNNYSVENTWNNQGYFVSGDLGYINNALYQTLSMSTNIYNSGFNARFGINENLKSRFKDSYSITSSNMIVAIPNNSWFFPPSNSSEIIVYDSFGNIVGSSVYYDDSMSLAIWGDDIFTEEKDGMLQDENFVLKYWNKDLNSIIDLDVEWEIGDEFYISNGLAAISSISLSNQILNSSVVELFPNPCVDQAKLCFHLPSDDFVNIKILDLQGKEISFVYSGYIAEGEINIPLNTSKIKMGTYIVSIIGRNFKRDILFSKI